MPRAAQPDPPGRPVVVSRALAHAAGITDGQLRHRLRSGAWTTLAPESGLAARFVEWDFPAPRLPHEWSDADGQAKYGLDPGRRPIDFHQEVRLRP